MVAVVGRLCPDERGGRESRHKKGVAEHGFHGVSGVAVEHLGAAIFFDQQHLVGVAAVAVLGAVHAGLANGHARHRQSQGVGLAVQQALDVARGRVALGDSPYIATSYSYDGQTWSQDRSILAGGIGNRTRRLQWYRQGSMTHLRTQRFRGTSDAHLAFLRLEAKIEGLAW